MATIYNDKKRWNTPQTPLTRQAGMQQPKQKASLNSGATGAVGASPTNSATGGNQTMTNGLPTGVSLNGTPDLAAPQKGPGEYQSQYGAQLDALLNQILNRDPFKYDVNGDMLYQQYKEQYQNAGKQAMADTMGQAATMTGGYGNSYANTAGNLAYQQYLTQLNDIVPELQQNAYNMYNQEYADLLNQYQTMMGAEQMAYSQYQDQMSNWLAQQQLDNSNYWNQQNMDLQVAQNAQNQQNILADAGWQLLQSGVMPSSAQLAAMQISQAQAQAIINQRGRRSGGGSTPRQQPEDTGGTEEVPVVNPPGATQDIHTNGGIGNQSTWTPNGPIINPAENAAFQLWLAQQRYKK